MESIPEEWRIKLPHADRLNVIDIPRTCGILNDHELIITEERDVGVILSRIATGKWSALAVTTAFLKRAIIAHQVVNCIISDVALNI